MASERAIAIQRAAAVDRIAAALTVLGDRFSIAADPNLLTPAGARYDPALGHAQQLTAMANVLDAVVTATEPAADAEAEPTPKAKEPAHAARKK